MLLSLEFVLSSQNFSILLTRLKELRRRRRTKQAALILQ